jgi:hypothetical protein
VLLIDPCQPEVVRENVAPFPDRSQGYLQRGENVRRTNDSDDSIMDKGDILEADIRKGTRNNRIL